MAVFTFALFDHVNAGDAEINAAVADADHNVGGTLEQHREAGQDGDGGFVLARVGLIDLQPGFGQEVQAVFGQAAFGRQRKSDRGRFDGLGHGFSWVKEKPPVSGGLFGVKAYANATDLRSGWGEVGMMMNSGDVAFHWGCLYQRDEDLSMECRMTGGAIHELPLRLHAVIRNVGFRLGSSYSKYWMIRSIRPTRAERVYNSS